MKICRGFIQDSGLWLEEILFFSNLQKEKKSLEITWMESSAPRRPPAINNKLEVLTESVGGVGGGGGGVICRPPPPPKQRCG